ncbi:hypothetical protein ACTXT7_012086 [Hymenolepis weldensis]
MCVVQLEFSNTVVNKGIEDIFPDDPTVIAEAVKKIKEQEKSAQAGSSQTTDSNVPCPSSAPPFIDNLLVAALLAKRSFSAMTQLCGYYDNEKNNNMIEI